jgi:hypothetical protein
MALNYVWRDSGVTERHGFQLVVDVARSSKSSIPGIPMKKRAELVLDGTYDFLSGLHHETYVYRGRGDKRFVYLAQAQNDWDDRVIAAPSVQTIQDLEGKTFLATTRAPCVFGNLKHSLELGGADLDRIDFEFIGNDDGEGNRRALKRIANGEAAAASVDIPYDLQGHKLGLHTLDIPSVPVIHNATMCANREWVVENEETTLAFLRSMIDAIHFFKTQRSRVCEIIERELSPEIGLQGMDEVEHLWSEWSRLLSPKPYPHPLAVWNVYNLDVAHDPAVNHIGPFETWDTGYLRAIDDAGYIEELYGGAREAANPKVNIAI